MGVGQYTAWLIGVILAVSANIISNLGLNFQKKAHSRREAKKESFKNICIESEQEEYRRHESMSQSEKEKEVEAKAIPIPLKELNINNNNNELIEFEDDKQGSYVCDGVWILGLFLQILGALLDFAALGYAPQSVVAPLGSLTLVVNVLVSPCMHDEKPSFKTIIATTIIIIGAGTTVASSPREDSVDSIEEVFGLYENTSFLMYAILTGGFITIGWCLTQYYVYLSRNKQRRYKKKYYKQHRFVIAAISGTMGAQNVLFAKSVSTLVIKSIQNGGRVLFAYWETYLLLAGLFSTIYFQLRWLNSGLKRFSALYVAPTFQAFWITVSVLGGLIVYKEFDDMIISQKIVFPLGVILTILGVFYLTTQGQPEKYKQSKNERNDNINNLKMHIKDHQKIIIDDDNNNNIDNNNDDDEEEVVQQQHDENDNNEENEDELAIDIAINNDDGDDKEEAINIINAPSPIDDDYRNREYEYDIITSSKTTGLITGTGIKSNSISIKTTKEGGVHGIDHGLMGLIKNLGDLGEASIVTGSSLGKLLLDPQGVYKDINLGANDEDTHYKDILSPQISSISELTEQDTISSDKLIDDEEIKHIQETITFLPEIDEISGGNPEKKRGKKTNIRRYSFNDYRDSTDHHSDNASERYNNRRRKKTRKRSKKRSRSHSPPLTTDEMAPHEIVWEKLTSIFDQNKKAKNKNIENIDSYDPSKENGYASMEHTPEIQEKQSMGFEKNQFIDLENDIILNESQSYYKQ